MVQPFSPTVPKGTNAADNRARNLRGLVDLAYHAKLCNITRVALQGADEEGDLLIADTLVWYRLVRF